MKKLLGIALLITYLTFDGGALIYTHYCDQTIAQVSLLIKNGPCCEETSACCHDASLRMAIASPYDSPESFRLHYPDIQSLFVIDNGYASALITRKRAPTYGYTTKATAALFLSNRVLRI